jgi:hypothetical protein
MHQVDITPFLIEYLSKEYIKEDIEIMLSEATIIVRNNKIIIVYKNGVIETIGVCLSQFSIDASNVKPQFATKRKPLN